MLLKLCKVAQTGFPLSIKYTNRAELSYDKVQKKTFIVEIYKILLYNISKLLNFYLLCPNRLNIVTGLKLDLFSMVSVQL